MSQVNAKTLMLGQNADQTKNFKITVPTPEDGTLTIERADGTDVLVVASNGVITGNFKTINNLLPMTTIPSGGLNVTGIPAIARRVTVHCKSVSNNSTGISGIRLGTASGLVSTGYASDYGYIEHIASSLVGYSTNGFFTSSNVAANLMQGKFVLELADDATNTWDCTFVGTNSSLQVGFVFGSISLPGPLTQLSMVAASGTFDSGQMSVDWEM